MSKCWEGPLNNFEIVFSHWRLHLNFPITWSCRRSEMLKMLPREKSEIQHFRGQTSFWGVFISFQFFWEYKILKYGSCLQLCLWLRSRSSSGSLGNFGKYLVFVKIEHQRCGQTFWSQIKSRQIFTCTWLRVRFQTRRGKFPSASSFPGQESQRHWSPEKMTKSDLWWEKN